MPRRYSNLLVPIVPILLSIATGALIATLVAPQIGAVAWLILAGSVAVPVAIRLAQGRMDLFEPVVFASIVYAGIFVVPCGIMLLSGYTYPLLPSADLSGGAIVIALGVLCFAAGYFLIVPRSFESRSDQRKLLSAQWATRGVVWAIVLALCAVSFLTYVFVFFPSAGGVSEYIDPNSGSLGSVDTLRGAGVARAAILLASVGFFIAVVHLLLRTPRRRSDVVLVFLAGAVSVITSVLSKNRVFVLWDLVVPVVILHYARRPIRVVEAVVGITALFLVTVAFTVALRSPTAFISRSDSGFLANISDFIVVQTGEMSVVSDIAQRQPMTLGYLNGGTFVATALNIVPRAVWAEKPATAGEIYTRYFLPNLWLSGATFIGVPWQGELWLNGGLLALIVGTFVTGSLSGLIYRRIWRKPSTLSIALRGLFSFSLFLLITRGSLEFFSFTLVWGLPLVLGILALKRHGASRHTFLSATDSYTTPK